MTNIGKTLYKYSLANLKLSFTKGIVLFYQIIYLYFNLNKGTVNYFHKHFSQFAED